MHTDNGHQFHSRRENFSKACHSYSSKTLKNSYLPQDIFFEIGITRAAVYTGFDNYPFPYRWDVYQKKLLLAVTVPLTIILYVLVLFLVYDVQNASDACSGCKGFTCTKYRPLVCDYEYLN